MNNAKRALIEVGWRQQQRASLYHMLLLRHIAPRDLDMRTGATICRECNGIERHAPQCESGLIERALAATAPDEIAAMLREVAI